MARMFVPGPVDVAPEVLQAMAQPMLPHRSKEYEEIHRRAAEKAQKIFYTKHRVFLGTHSGSGMQEVGIRNLVSSDVLCCVNGAFSKRWFEVAISNGKSADKLDFDWGKPVGADALRDALKAKHYEAVTIVHNETSTGVESPVQLLCQVAQETSPDTLVLVDAVSSLGGTKIDMDAWGIDYLLTSSQKCLALPPGLSLAGVNERAMAKAATVENRGWYFDLLLMEKHRLKDSTGMTPVIPLVYALDFQLDRIFEEGLENRFTRHQAMSARVYDWCEAQGMPSFAEKNSRSKTVATISNLRSIDVSALNRYLLQNYQMRISGGYGDLKSSTFRIATMGEISLSDVDMLLEGMQKFLAL